MEAVRAERTDDGPACDDVGTFGPGFARPEDSFGFRLWHVMHFWKRRVEADLAPLNLTHTQFVVLALTLWLSYLGETPSQSRIAAYGQLDRMTLSNVLRLLEEKGYIERRPHPSDPRANWVVVTDTGQKIAIKARERMWQTQEAFFGRLGAEGKAVLGEQLDAILRYEKWTCFGVLPSGPPKTNGT